MTFSRSSAQQRDRGRRKRSIRFTAASSSASSATELALYGVDRSYQIDGTTCEPRVMTVLDAAAAVRIRSSAPARIVLIGGEPLDGRHFMWWNFVATRKKRIAQAAEQWAKQQMPRIPGETDWIPLPGQPG